MSSFRGERFLYHAAARRRARGSLKPSTVTSTGLPDAPVTAGENTCRDAINLNQSSSHWI